MISAAIQRAAQQAAQRAADNKALAARRAADRAAAATPPAPVAAVPLPEAPSRMDHHEKMRIRAAAFRATRLYPGAVGELISRELLIWEEFGYRLGGSQMVMRLVDHVLKTPIPPAPDEPAPG